MNTDEVLPEETHAWLDRTQEAFVSAGIAAFAARVKREVLYGMPGDGAALKSAIPKGAVSIMEGT